MISIVLPTEALRARLAPRLGDAHIEVWRLGDDGPPAADIDLLVLPYMVPAEQLRHLEDVSVARVQSQMLGYDGVAEHLPPGMTFSNAVGVHEGSTAELTIALILAMQRGIPDAVRAAGEGRWGHQRRPGLAGKRVVLVGAGGVGAEIAQRIAPFGAEVHVVARTARSGVHGTDELPTLLPSADVVVIAIPLSAETRHFVDAAFLGAMPDRSLLVNVSRGGLVDTDALVAELATRRLRAALDVTDPEPLPPDHPLWSVPGVLITPHLGGDTDAMDQRIDDIILEQVRRLRAGESPLNLVHDATR